MTGAAPGNPSSARGVGSRRTRPASAVQPIWCAPRPSPVSPSKYSLTRRWSRRAGPPWKSADAPGRRDQDEASRSWHPRWSTHFRGGHYGQRSCEPHKQAAHMAAPTNLQREHFPCQLGAVYTWHSTEASDVRSNIGNELPQRALALGKVASHNPKSISASGVGSRSCPGQAEHSIAS